MKTITGLVQGSEQWHARRATTRNASEATALMGASPYKTRAELLREKATGIAPEHDAATLARFARGHEVEPALVAYVENIIGESLYPITGESDDGYLSASFDGVNLLETIICEVKQANSAKMDSVRAGGIPEQDYWQIVQQFAVCDTAETCYYVVGDGTAEDTVYIAVPRSAVATDIPKLRAAWEQFDRDREAYKPEPVKAAVVAAPVEGFGALSLRVEGRVLASNLDAFKAGAEAFIARLPKPDELQTDQDFADADAAVKACAEAESRIKAAKDAALSQMADVETVMRTADSVHDAIRAARLALEKVVKAEKENRRNDIVAKARDSVIEHYRVINESLGEHAIGIPASLTAEIGASIKGKKSLSSMRDAVDSVAANAKIAASQQADRVRANMAILAGHQDHSHLFADRVQLCATKAPDDLRNLITARIAEHQQKEREREEAQRERIRQEEVARLERELREAAERAAREDAERAQVAEAKSHGVDVGNAQAAAPATIPADTAITGTAHAATTGGARRIKLGDINAAIAPLSISADGLAQLGFKAAGTSGAAKLYLEVDFPKICEAMARVLANASVRRVA